MTTPSDPTDPQQTARPAEGFEQHRPPVFNLHGAIVALSLLCIGVQVLRGFLPRDADTWLLVETAFFPIRYSPQILTLDFPTVFSPITYAFLHGGWVHLTINIVWLAVFGSPLAYRIGWTRSIAFWVVTAAFAALAHLLVYFGDQVPVIGASGAVSGFMGAAARFGLRANRRHPRRGFDGPLLSIPETLRARGVVPFLLVWIGMNVVIGLNIFDQQGAPIAWEAHIGGLLAGFFLIPIFDRRRSAVPDQR